MKKLRPLIAALMALGFYTITDILVWQRIFETNQLVMFANTYHAGWFVSLAGYAMVGVVVMSDRIKDCLFFLVALFIGAYSGLEDILYYVLDRKPVPESLPWLEHNPLIRGTGRADLILSAIFWLAVLIALYAVLYLRRDSARRVGLDLNQISSAQADPRRR
jgi:hypothetical protein